MVHRDVVTLPTQRYVEQTARWPRTGRHILAHSDETSVIVYQAYRPSIARYAVANGAFGGPDFSFSRMSWIKPNFLWMMYRSAWATSEGQEAVLAVGLRGAALRAFATTEVREIIDMTPFVIEQRPHAEREGWEQLRTPVEDVYRLVDASVASNIGLDVP